MSLEEELSTLNTELNNININSQFEKFLILHQQVKLFELIHQDKLPQGTPVRTALNQFKIDVAACEKNFRQKIDNDLKKLMQEQKTHLIESQTALENLNKIRKNINNPKKGQAYQNDVVVEQKLQQEQESLTEGIKALNSMQQLFEKTNQKNDKRTKAISALLKKSALLNDQIEEALRDQHTEERVIKIVPDNDDNAKSAEDPIVVEKTGDKTVDRLVTLLDQQAKTIFAKLKKLENTKKITSDNIFSDDTLKDHSKNMHDMRQAFSILHGSNIQELEKHEKVFNVLNETFNEAILEKMHDLKTNHDALLKTELKKSSLADLLTHEDEVVKQEKELEEVKEKFEANQHHFENPKMIEQQTKDVSKMLKALEKHHKNIEDVFDKKFKKTTKMVDAISKKSSQVSNKKSEALLKEISGLKQDLDACGKASEKKSHEKLLYSRKNDIENLKKKIQEAETKLDKVKEGKEEKSSKRWSFFGKNQDHKEQDPTANNSSRP